MLDPCKVFLLLCDYLTILFLKDFDYISLVSHSGRAYFIGKGKAPSLVGQEEKNLVGPLVTDQCTYIPYCSRIGLVQKSFSNNIFHIFFSSALRKRWQKYSIDSKLLLCKLPITHVGFFQFMQIKCILEIISILIWDGKSGIKKAISFADICSSHLLSYFQLISSISSSLINFLNVSC